MRKAIFTRQRFIAAVGVGIVGAALLGPGSPAARAQDIPPPPHEVTIDAAVAFQTVEGFGTCTSSANPVWNPANWSLGSRNNLGYLYARDLGLSILRLYIEPNTLMGVGGVDRLDTVVDFSGNAAADAAKINLDQTRTRFQDEALVWLRNNALEPAAFKAVGAVWSPPHWMKEPTGNQVTDFAGVRRATPFLGNFGNDTIGGILKADSATQFAYFCSAYVQAIRNATGITLHGFSLLNESTFENPFNSATWELNGSFDRYPVALAAVRDDFARYTWNTRLMGPHVAGLGPNPGSPWALRQQNQLIRAVKNYAADPNLIRSLAIYTHHDYVLDPVKSAVMHKAHLDGKASLPNEPWAFWLPDADVPGVRADNKQAWMSEVSGEDQNLDGAMVLAQKMHDAFTWGENSAYLYWQLADGHTMGTRDTLIGTDDFANPTANRKYAAFKHFTRYIRPGARRVRATPSAVGGANEMDTSNAVDISAYRHAGQRTLTVVLVNRRPTTQFVNLSLANVALTNNRARQWRTSSTEGFRQLADALFVGGKTNLRMPGRSIVTLYGFTP